MTLAHYIHAVGAGAKRARALTRDEAVEAMTLVATGAADPVQVGALLLALRMKGETAEELAGFSDAFARFAPRIAAPTGTLVVDAHADGHRDPPSVLARAACAVAALGVPVLLGVMPDDPFARHDLGASLAALGLGGELDPARAARDLARAGLGALDLRHGCPPLHRLITLRPLLGVRTAAHTVAKLLSPLAPGPHLAAVFHAPYLEVTCRALVLSGAPAGAVVQQLGGLPEAAPGKRLRLARVPDAVTTSLDIPAAEAAADPLLARTAATAALMLHATGLDLPAALAEATAALGSGRDDAIAARLRG